MKNKITNFEFGTLNYFLTRSFLVSVTFNAIIKMAKQDSWLIPLITIIFGIIYIIFLNKIMNFEPNLSINEKIKLLFNNKIFAYFIISICFLFATLLGMINFLNIINFIQSQFISKTPLIVISLTLIVATIYIISKGMDNISKVSVILFYISIILFIISFIGIFPKMDISNIKPIFRFKLKNIFNSLLNFYAFNISPIFMLATIPKNKIKNENSKKYLSIFFIISCITLFIMSLSTITTFGYKLSLLYEYPEYQVLKNVSLFGISSRIESILAMQLIFDAIICHLIVLNYLCDCVTTIKKINNKNIIYIIISILFIIGSIYFSKYNMYIDNIIIKYLPFLSTIFSIFIIILLNKKISNKLLIKNKNN